MQIEDLSPNPGNPRTITDAKLSALKKALEEFGDLGGFVFNRKTKQLVGGHQRAKLFDRDAEIVIEHKYKKPSRTGTVAEGYAVLNGERFKYREVSWDVQREHAANIAANKGAGEWDMPKLGEWIRDLGDFGFDLDLTMFDDEERKQFLADSKDGTEGLTDPDAVPENVETRCKPGDLWVLGNHRLLCGDSTSSDDVARLFAGDRAELCFTSPPYADQREYNGGKELSTEHLATFIRSAHGNVGLFAVNLGLARKDGEVSQYWDDYIKEAKACGLKLLSWNVWDKGECGSISNQTAMFGISHEWILVFGSERKNLNLTVPNKSAGLLVDYIGIRQADGSVKRSKERIVADFSQMKTVYSVTAQKARDDIDHPARFPVGFPLGYIEACTHPGQCVYEPFTGSGSTLIACEKTARRCFGMEIDPKYCDVILKRWEDFTRKKAVKASKSGKTQAGGKSLGA